MNLKPRVGMTVGVWCEDTNVHEVGEITFLHPWGYQVAYGTGACSFNHEGEHNCLCPKKPHRVIGEIKNVGDFLPKKLPPFGWIVKSHQLRR